MTQRTWDFKVAVFQLLESSGLGYDTRYRYYRTLFPDHATASFARMVCDPIEYYDPEWPPARVGRAPGVTENDALTAFVMERDTCFLDQAAVGIYCYDEAGMGSGINAMRLLTAGKPILGFCHRRLAAPGWNPQNVLQLGWAYPGLFELVRYSSIDEAVKVLQSWLTDRVAHRLCPYADAGLVHTLTCDQHVPNPLLGTHDRGDCRHDTSGRSAGAVSSGSRRPVL